MKCAMIGLGKMGANMTKRLLKGGHEIVVFDLNEEAIRDAEAGDAQGARTLEEAVGKLETPRALWVMVPAGEPTESTIRRLAELQKKGLHFVDVGTSGGGQRLGACRTERIGALRQDGTQRHRVRSDAGLC